MKKLFLICFITTPFLFGCQNKPSGVFNVIWKNYDGTELLTEKYNYGEMPSYKGETPSRESSLEVVYTFTGWSPEFEPIKEDKVYFATFDVSYDNRMVTWKNWDGAEFYHEPVPVGKMPVYKGKEPTREPTAEATYTFTGWNPDVSVVTDTVEYTAKFEPTTRNYTVKWLNWDGSLLEKDSPVPYGSLPSYDRPDPPSRPSDQQYNWNFTGWDKDITETIKGDTDFKAKFNPVAHSYKVTFLNYDDSELQSSYVKIGDIPRYFGETPVGEDSGGNMVSVFSGWDKSYETVTNHDLTYKATFVNESYIPTTLTFESPLEQDVPIKIGIINDNEESFTVNWGDGSDLETISGTKTIMEHNYTASVDQSFTITINNPKEGFSFYLYDNEGKLDGSKNYYVKSIDISNCIRRLPRAAFNSMGLETFNPTNNIIRIEDFTFNNCPLSSFYIPITTTYIGQHALYGGFLTKISIPKFVTFISHKFGAFEWQSNSLTEIKVDQDNLVYDSRNNCNAIITKIPVHDTEDEVKANTLLLGCKNTIIPNDVEVIGRLAFAKCKGLTTLTLPDSLKTIEQNAFDQSGLQSLNIPKNVTLIESGAFYHIRTVTSVTVDPQNKVYDSRNNCNAIVETFSNKLLFGFDISVIDETIESIEYEAFAFYANTSISIPTSVTKIGGRAFMYSKLTSIFIPDSVAQMGYYTFEACNDMKTINCQASSKPDGWDDGWLGNYCPATVNWGVSPQL